MTTSSYNNKKSADSWSKSKTNLSSLQYEAIINSLKKIKDSTEGVGNKRNSVNSFYIQTNEYAERIIRQKLESLEQILKRINNITEGNDLNDVSNYGVDNLADLVYKLTKSCLSPYGELMEWREDISKLIYDTKHDSVFNSLHEAPKDFINAFEKFCLSMPKVIDHCIESFKSGHGVVESIPFLKEKDISTDFLISQMARLLSHNDNFTVPHQDAINHDFTTVGEYPTDKRNYIGSYPGYLDAPSKLIDNHSQLLIERKEPGWKHLLFANEIRVKVKAAQGSFAGPDINRGQSCYPFIQTTAYATRVCLTKLDQLDDIFKEISACAVNADIINRLVGRSDNESIAIILQAVTDYIKPYIDINIWIRDVSKIRHDHKYDRLFSLLLAAPNNAKTACEGFLIDLYDKFCQHLNNYRNDPSKGEASWYLHVTSINSESIHNELRKLSELDLEGDDFVQCNSERKSADITVRESNIELATLSVAHDQTVKNINQELDLPHKACGIKLGWVPPGEIIKVHEFEIYDGMVYVGSSACEPDACQIDPALDVRISEGRGFNVRQIYYTYGYGDITPEARGAYLTWLATGKSAPNANIGNIFLYFYGLERRVLLEPQLAEKQAEIPVIEAELRRLLGIYGDNGCFSGYATSLLEFLEARSLLEAPLPDSPPECERSWPMPLELRAGIAKYVAQKVPIPGDWAFLWWKAHPETNLPTLAEHSPEEFHRMFIERYHQVHGAGILVKAPTTYLMASYRPISPSLNGRVFDVGSELPDVTLSSGPIKKFAAIAEACYQSLDRYSLSRHLAYNPDKAGRIDALLELPISQLPDHLRHPLLKIYNGVFGVGATQAIQFENLQSLLPTWRKVNKSSHDDFVQRFFYLAMTEPVTVRPPVAGLQGFSIPNCPNEKATQGLDLDFAKVSSLKAESQRVTELLHTIFQTTSQEVSPVSDDGEETPENLWGLSTAFSDFLRIIATSKEWSRAELEELAVTRSLMLDGVLEHINEAALDRYDQSLTDGDDPVEINQELIKEITP